MARRLTKEDMRQLADMCNKLARQCTVSSHDMYEAAARIARAMLDAAEYREYRDTGLAPAEMAEYARAKAEGRLVVLPCKPGDTLYLAKFNGVGEYEDPVDEMDYTGHIFLACDLPAWEGSTRVPLSMFGKTIFLTRESAVAALKGVCDEKR